MPRSAARVACAVAALGLACGAEDGPSGTERPNVILISIDTLRPDHLRCYGYVRPISPHIDAFREDAVLFEDAISHAPSTLPAHASLLTSLLPQHHRAWHTAGLRLPAGAVTLAEHLRTAGYATLAVVGGGQLAPEYGLDQGFAAYRATGIESATDPFAYLGSARLETEVSEAVDLLDRLEQGPFFLFLHTYQIHHPYTPDDADLAALEAEYTGNLPAAISIQLLQDIKAGRRSIDAADRSHVVSTYDAEILSMDRAFGRFLEALRKRDLYRDSLIVVTSDHGEEFGEHGAIGWHSHTLFDELLRVPLLVKLPDSRSAGATVTGQVRGIDLAPTILAVLGLEAPSEFTGASLLPYLLGTPAVANPAAAGLWRETAPHEVDPITHGLRESRWKLGEGRLYDLSQDRWEMRDLAEIEPAERARLERELDNLLAQRPALEPEHAKPGPRTLEQLRALGYAVGESPVDD